MGALEELLPVQIKHAATLSGVELVLPLSEALSALEIAKHHQIAVLGVEQFRVQTDGFFLVLDYSGYDAEVSYNGEWGAYADELNLHAEQWLLKHKAEQDHGFILTSISKHEFEEPQRQLSMKPASET